MTPTTTSFSSTNYYAALAWDDDDDIDDTSHAPPSTAPPLQHTALSDLGATSHFIADGAPVLNKRIDTNPITIRLPDGATLQSTHTCDLDLPGIRPAATRAHIVPGLTHASLLSTA